MSGNGFLKIEGFSLAQGPSGGKVWHPECGVAGHSVCSQEAQRDGMDTMLSPFPP